MDRHCYCAAAVFLPYLLRARLVYRFVGSLRNEIPRAHCDLAISNADIDGIVAYALGIYLLNLFLAFLQPKFDPSNEAIDNEMEDGAAGGLPTKQDEEFRPFIRRLPEFKFWHSATRVILIGFFCSWFEIFNVPVFWPVLVMYWFILFFLTSKSTPSHPAYWIFR